MSDEAIATYRQRYPRLREVASELEALLRTWLGEISRIDRIAARAKDPERFAAKAAKTLEDGTLKYIAPLNQIQDQIGARIIVFYREDVGVVATELERYLRHVERRDHVPDSYWEFGYFGRHWIFALPDDVVPMDVSRDIVPRFFELQVKTLFQHAWSEANHDLGYKSPTELSPDHQRLFAYTAAQAWGADRVFDELRDELIDSSGG